MSPWLPILITVAGVGVVAAVASATEEPKLAAPPPKPPAQRTPSTPPGRGTFKVTAYVSNKNLDHDDNISLSTETVTVGPIPGLDARRPFEITLVVIVPAVNLGGQKWLIFPLIGYGDIPAVAQDCMRWNFDGEELARSRPVCVQASTEGKIGTPPTLSDRVLHSLAKPSIKIDGAKAYISFEARQLIPVKDGYYQPSRGYMIGVRADWRQTPV